MNLFARLDVVIIFKISLSYHLHATFFLWHSLEEPVQLMLIPPVWAHEQIHLHHSLVTELDGAQRHSSVVVVMPQCSAEKGVKLLYPWLEFSWFMKDSVAIDILI